METTNLTKRILKWLEEYKRATACQGVVLGISGGKDSTTVAMLAKKVWGEKVMGVLMPNGEQSDLKDSLDIVETLKIPYRIVNIGETYKALVKAVDSISDKAKINIAPRIRMTVLYSIAQSLNYRVIGTGNASERYIGWFTKWGDGAYDLDPIAALTCTEVIEVGKQLAKEFGLDAKYIVKPPADGLTGRSDEENFGFGYAELDAVIASERTSDDKMIKGINAEVLKRINKMHEVSIHKLNLPPIFENKK